jgi:hypothetical protein
MDSEALDYSVNIALQMPHRNQIYILVNIEYCHCFESVKHKSPQGMELSSKIKDNFCYTLKMYFVL